MRGDDNREQNIETLHIAKEYLGKGVAAIDIAGAEALYPTENFEELFTLARDLGVPFTIHAGEADRPSSVYRALANAIDASFADDETKDWLRSELEKRLHD